MRRLLAIVLLTSTGLFAATATPRGSGNLASGDDPSGPGLTVHEWGTFTSVAGLEGLAVDWQPAGGPSDLPCFVDSVVGQVKSGLRGKVRMETPVLYFYGTSAAPVDVRVAFPDGRITEWFPRADVSINDGIGWRDVVLEPATPPVFPTEDSPSHYYAARETDAIPLRVGDEVERFLFYRGVGDFQPPVSARLSEDGRSIRVSRVSDGSFLHSPGEPVGALVQFENRGGQIAYRVATTTELGRLDSEGVSLPAAADEHWMRDMNRLAGDLSSMLVAAGLYRREADAMVETWRDSWFEEGSRIFYLVPKAVVDAILPLDIQPEPAEVRRAFVGRMEVLTPATLDAVLDAIGAGDMTALEPYGRFLEPILNHMVARAELRAPELTEAFGILDRLQGGFIVQATRCN